MTTEAVGVDIGGLRVKAVRLRVENDGDVVVVDRRIVELSDDDRSAPGMSECVATMARELGVDSTVGVGIGVTGLIRADQGIVAFSPAFPLWTDYEIGPDVGARLACPVTVENDANVFGFAEVRAGAARGLSWVAGFTLGTGVGGALILDGRLIRGARGMGAEAGHVTVWPDGVVCGCGNRGCIEQYASTQFLVREADAIEHRAVAGAERVDYGRRLAAAAREGDVEARRIFADFGTNLGIAAAGMINLLDLEAVVLGGGLVAAHDLFGPTYESTVRERAFDATADDVRLLTAALGNDAGALGAGLLAVEASASA